MLVTCAVDITFVFIFDYVQSHHCVGEPLGVVIVNLLPHIEAGGGRIGAEEGPVPCLQRTGWTRPWHWRRCDSMLEKFSGVFSVRSSVRGVTDYSCPLPGVWEGGNGEAAC